MFKQNWIDAVLVLIYFTCEKNPLLLLLLMLIRLLLLYYKINKRIKSWIDTENYIFRIELTCWEKRRSMLVSCVCICIYTLLYTPKHYPSYSLQNSIETNILIFSMEICTNYQWKEKAWFPANCRTWNYEIIFFHCT